MCAPPQTSVPRSGLAAKIGYHHTTIYQYFTDKSEILVAICEETFAGLNTEFDRIRQEPVSPADRLLHATHAVVNFCLSHPHHYRAVFFTPEMRGGNSVYEHMGRMGGSFFRTLEPLFRECVDSMSLKIPDARVLAFSWWSMAMGFVASLIIQSPGSFVPPSRAIVDASVDLLWRGLLSFEHKV